MYACKCISMYNVLYKNTHMSVNVRKICTLLHLSVTVLYCMYFTKIWDYYQYEYLYAHANVLYVLYVLYVFVCVLQIAIWIDQFCTYVLICVRLEWISLNSAYFAFSSEYIYIHTHTYICHLGWHAAQSLVILALTLAPIFCRCKCEESGTRENYQQCSLTLLSVIWPPLFLG
jgi:hypothetical protein